MPATWPGCHREREQGMSKKRKPELRIPTKIYWHLYGLQTLSSDKFVKVVNKILRHEYHLIK